MTVDIETRWMSDYNRKKARTAFSQPGIRYSQAASLIKSLMQDDKFRDLSLVERKRVTERILAEIKGRMMEDIVLLETKLSKKNCEVFRLQFAIGEFDMVVLIRRKKPVKSMKLNIVTRLFYNNADIYWINKNVRILPFDMEPSLENM